MRGRKMIVKVLADGKTEASVRIRVVELGRKQKQLSQ
jgi:hypothetical protein